ncbi:MAG: alpha/beta hydrolase [Desulfatibacillum sp.]|nr:alpha/beta hydrolase [Desulfatibacillum sp.]
MEQDKYPWQGQVVNKSLKTPDGVKISYQTLGTDKRKPVVCIAHGLGARLYAWAPILETILPQYRVITWHYRGLYQSETQEDVRRFAIGDHADDLKAILSKEKVDKAHIIGWSMGVQVALEFAHLYPDNLEKLVLINGTYGHALSTGFQPIFRIPYMADFLHVLIESLKSRKESASLIRKVATNKKVTGCLGAAYSALRGSPYFTEVLQQYADDVLGDSFNNYLRLFQELDAHSVYHNLPEILHPALVIWGDLDPLTPAYLSRRIRRRLVNAYSMRLWLGTHFVHLEYPKKVPKRILRFLGSHIIEPDV